MSNARLKVGDQVVMAPETATALGVPAGHAVKIHAAGTFLLAMPKTDTFLREALPVWTRRATTCPEHHVVAVMLPDGSLGMVARDEIVGLVDGGVRALEQELLEAIEGQAMALAEITRTAAVQKEATAAARDALSRHRAADERVRDLKNKLVAAHLEAEK